MKFTPATKEELEMEGLIPEGVYPFRLTKSEEKMSKKNQPYFNVRLAVFAGGENGHGVFDNPSPEFMKFKLAHLCETTGLKGHYESGNLTNDDLVGVEGYVEIGIQKAKDGNPAKNVVFDYLSKEQYDEAKAREQKTEAAQPWPTGKAANQSDASTPADDDVPF